MTQPFHFKQFSIYQERCAMKVGFDAVLLGAWVDVAGARRILDLGTGTGVIALMLAQRGAGAQIDGVEIEASAAAQAAENVRRTPWVGRVTIHHHPIQEHQAAPYDLIVSNPPFFPDHSGTPSSDAARRLARQNSMLTAVELCDQARRLLAADGRLALIWPHVTGESLIKAASRTGLYLRERVTVYPNPHKPAHRLLLAFSRRQSAYCERTLTIETAQHHVYTPSFAELTEPFYLD